MVSLLLLGLAGAGIWLYFSGDEKDTPKISGEEMGNITASGRWQMSHVTATATGLPNDLPAGLIPNVQATGRLLDSIWDMVGEIRRVTSWYRSPEVNKAVGGVSNSAHSKGLAADIDVGLSPEMAMLGLWRNRFSINVDKVILYEPAPGKPEIHIQAPHPNNQPRRQFLLKKSDGGYVTWNPPR